jgi:hypothetical protein
VIKKLVSYNTQIANELSGLKESQFKQSSGFPINCTNLPTSGSEKNIYHHDNYKVLFEELEQIKESPCVYWFELKESGHGQAILSSLKLYFEKWKNEKNAGTLKKLRKYRAIPAMKERSSDINTNILYVGKVKRDLKGRMVPHLGYYHTSPDTQGLQLCHWAKAFKLNITFNYIQLPEGLQDIAGYYEMKLARELKPLLGKHKS